MLTDFREIMYAELRDPEFRREFIRAYYEQDGVPGIRRALRCLAEADLYERTGVLPTEKPRSTGRVVRIARSKRILSDADVLRGKLRRHGLDFALATSGAA